MSGRKLCTHSGVFAWTNGGLALADAAQHIDLSYAEGGSFLDYISRDDVIRATGDSRLTPTFSVSVDFKLNDLAWSSLATNDHPLGFLIGGGESGHVSVFDAASLLQHGKLKREGDTCYHSGHVLSVDVSQLDPKWVCTGGAAGGVLLWDMNNPLAPMTPGTPNFSHQIKYVSFNKCVNHLLGSLTSERCSIWDLRAPGAPVLDIADIGNGVMEWSAMSWNPFEGTNLCLSSQSNSSPAVHKWDLRYASSPISSYVLHSRGIYGMHWNPRDGNMLATVGRDEQIIIQDPNTGQLLGRIQTRGWARRLLWSYDSPSLFAVSYFDRPVEVFSITPFGTTDSVIKEAEFQLATVPAWLSTGRCGAKFSYGNKLTFFKVEDHKSSPLSVVSVAKVDGDTAVRTWISELQAALDSNQLASFCEDRANTTSEPALQLLWTFLSAHALNSSRSEYLRILGMEGAKNEDDALKGIMEQMEEIRLSKRGSAINDDSDQEECSASLSSTEVALSPISLSKDSEDGCLKLMCCGDGSASIAWAISHKQWALALLLAESIDDHSAVQFIARSIEGDASSDNATRVAALMAADMWHELVNACDISDWKLLLSLILSKAPPNKIRLLCSELAAKLIANGQKLDAAPLAVVASNVERMMEATTSLSLFQQISMAVLMRHSLGGGSSRIATAGPLFLSALEECANELAKEGFTNEAWRLVESIPEESCSDSLRELRYVLFQTLNGAAPALHGPPADPFVETRAQFAQLYGGSSSSSSFQQGSRYLGRRQAPQQYFSSQPTQASLFYNAASASLVQGQTQFPDTRSRTGSLITSPSPPSCVYDASSFTSPGMSLPQNGYTSPAPAMSISPHIPQPITPPPVVPYPVPQPPAPPPTGMHKSFYEGRSRTLSSSSHASVPAPSYSSKNAMAMSSVPYPHAVEKVDQPPPTAGNITMMQSWNDPPMVPAGKPEPKIVENQVMWTMSTLESKSSRPEKEPEPAANLYTLSETDNYIVNTLKAITAQIRQFDGSPVTTHKLVDFEQKMTVELIPRLANSKFSQQTQSQLCELAGHISRCEYALCKNICGNLARGSDFVELSPIMPGLRSLISLAERTLHC